MSPSVVASSTAAAVAALLYYWLTTPRVTGIKSLRGPPSDNWLFGNLGKIREPGDIVPQWTAQYGTSFSVGGFLCSRRLYLLDPKAIGHILSHASDFPKPWVSNLTQGAVLIG